jgi:hypothetical protein
MVEGGSPSYKEGMPSTVDQPRFHYDRERTGAPPSLAEMHDWAVSILVGPHGGDVRDCIRAASIERARGVGSQVAVRDVANMAACALRAAAAEVHDIGREFGFDPTRHPDTEDSSGSLVLVRIASDFPDPRGTIRRDLVEIGNQLVEAMRLTAEACALREMLRGMVQRGRADADAIRAVADDASPATMAILPDLWVAVGGRPEMLHIPKGKR